MSSGTLSEQPRQLTIFVDGEPRPDLVTLTCVGEDQTQWLCTIEWGRPELQEKDLRAVIVQVAEGKERRLDIRHSLWRYEGGEWVPMS